MSSAETTHYAASSKAVAVDQADADAASEPAVACALVHEHDDVACAAPSSAEMTLDVVGARLSALWVRIRAVFADESDRQYGLEDAQQEVEDLLGLLGLPVPAPAGTE